MTVMAIPSFLSDILSLSSKYFSEFLHYLYPQYYTVKTAIPVLNALIMAFALLVAGSSGAKISCVSPVMISFWSRISCSSMAFSGRCFLK